MSLSNLIKKISHTYFKEKATGKFKNAPVGDLVRKDMVAELSNIEELKKYKIKGSIGNGQFAAIPWVAIMNKDVTTTTSKGMYIVFLFSSDEKEVYLTLNPVSYTHLTLPTNREV